MRARSFGVLASTDRFCFHLAQDEAVVLALKAENAHVQAPVEANSELETLARIQTKRA